MKVKADGRVTDYLEPLLAILLATIANRIANRIHISPYVQNLSRICQDKFWINFLSLILSLNLGIELGIELGIGTKLCPLISTSYGQKTGIIPPPLEIKRPERFSPGYGHWGI